MKKQMLLRGLMGIPSGISIGYIITIIISWLFLDGEYSPVVSTLIYRFGNEINAVIFQTILFAAMGFFQAAATVVWDMEDWGLMKQTGIHFFIISITMLPIAYFSHWIERSFRGIAIFFCICVVMYALIWIIQYSIWKYKIKRIDKNLNNRK